MIMSSDDESFHEIFESFDCFCSGSLGVGPDPLDFGSVVAMFLGFLALSFGYSLVGFSFCHD